MMPNAMMVIFPYRHEDYWVFDYEPAGLIREPFVSGMPAIIDSLVQDIPNAAQGFKLLFSPIAFSEYQAELVWVREQYGGNWYRWQAKNLEGWLSPALFKYFPVTPHKIYCKAEQMSNAMMVIFPYRYEHTWVFDDERVGLVREPFVSGIPEMIELLVKEIPHAEKGFKLLFSGNPFPGYQAELTLVREEYGGNWYRWELNNKEGWLCPALFKYFNEAPRKLYCKAERLHD
ncbi:MAG: DUF6717 family protein [Cyanobacteriota bacterium]